MFVMSLLLLLLVSVGSLGSLSVYGLNDSNENLRKIYQNHRVSFEALHLISDHMQQTRANAVLFAYDKNTGKTNEQQAAIGHRDAEMNQAWQNFRVARMTGEESALAEQFYQSWQSFIASRNRIIALTITGSHDFAVAHIEVLNALYDRAHGALSGLLEMQRRGAVAEFENAQVHYQNMLVPAIVAIAAGILCAVLMGFFLIRAMAMSRNEGIALGDTTASTEKSDRDEANRLLEIQKILNTNLIALVSKVRVKTNFLHSTEEKESGKETVSSIAKITPNNTQHETGSCEGVKGNTVASQVAQALTDINENSKRIAGVINVIEGIAFQSHALALNTAIEAARAGEQGRGVAMVAIAVRKMAQQSASAAKEIKELINDSGSKVYAATMAVDELVKAVEQVAGTMSELSAAPNVEVTESSQDQVQVDNVQEAKVFMLSGGKWQPYHKKNE